MGLDKLSDLYTKDYKIYCKDYLELYIPMAYFEDKVAENTGAIINTFGVLYYRVYVDNKPKDLCRLDIPAMIEVYTSTFEYSSIVVPNSGALQVMVVKYLPNTPIMAQSITRGKEVAEKFLHMMINGKLPHTLDYRDLINLWWKNLEISGVSFQVPSKVYEMIIANVYRSPTDMKRRFGQYIGKQSKPDFTSYKTGTIRDIVKNLSTFSGMVFEDMGNMISNGIANSIDNIEEPVSPLEKIIHY